MCPLKKPFKIKKKQLHPINPTIIFPSQEILNKLKSTKYKNIKGNSKLRRGEAGKNKSVFLK
jgi:hypothetical protein